MKPTHRAIDVNNLYPKLYYSPHSLDKLFDLLDSLKAYPIPNGDLSIVFMNEASLSKLHEDYLDDPSPTDVITFPGDPTMDFAGEICISIDEARKESEQRKLPLNHEISLYLIHGWLHLAGLNDLELAEREAMRKAEQEILQKVENAGAFPDFSIP